MENFSQELEDIFKSDQEDRTNHQAWLDVEYRIGIFKRDQERRKRAAEIIEQGGLKIAEDYYHAAMIFQHGEGPDDFKKANELAKQAMDLGLEEAKWLYAASLDRLLLSEGKPQKFGTQYWQEADGAEIVLREVDPSTTDEERAKYNIHPLAEIPKVLPKE